jgi:hypothetical protein
VSGRRERIAGKVARHRLLPECFLLEFARRWGAEVERLAVVSLTRICIMKACSGNDQILSSDVYADRLLYQDA